MSVLTMSDLAGRITALGWRPGLAQSAHGRISERFCSVVRGISWLVTIRDAAVRDPNPEGLFDDCDLISPKLAIDHCLQRLAFSYIDSKWATCQTSSAISGALTRFRNSRKQMRRCIREDFAGADDDDFNSANNPRPKERLSFFRPHFSLRRHYHPLRPLRMKSLVHCDLYRSKCRHTQTWPCPSLVVLISFLLLSFD